MKFQGSKMIQLECIECHARSPKFRVFLYDYEGMYEWNGELPEGWTTYDEAELLEDTLVFGGCPKHPVD